MKSLIQAVLYILSQYLNTVHILDIELTNLELPTISCVEMSIRLLKTIFPTTPKCNIHVLPGHFVQNSLGFGYVEPQHVKPGTRLRIDFLGKACAAKVLG